MLQNKSILVIVFQILFVIKITACEITIEKIALLESSQLKITLSNGKEITKKVRYKNGTLQANYKGITFLIIQDSIQNNAQAESLKVQMLELKEIKYGELSIEEIGYIIYDKQGSLYMFDLFEGYSLKKDKIDRVKCKKEKLYIDRKQEIVITIVRYKNKK